MIKNAGAARAPIAGAVSFIILAAWIVFTGWTVLNVFNALKMLDHSSGGLMQGMGAAAATATLALNLWALAAALVFIPILKNPFGWLNVKRLTFGVIALAIMLGRLDLGWLPSLLEVTPISFLGVVTVFAAAPIALMLGGLGVIFAIALVIGLLYMLFVAVPLALYNQIFEFEKQRAEFRYKTNGLIGYVNRFFLWVTNTPPPPFQPDDSKGARFATPEEIARLRVLDGSTNMGFGHDAGRAPVFIKNEKHVLIIASTRSGKGVSLIIPHLLRYRGSAFVLDPKGENARATGRTRAALNNQVHYLDPFGISGKPKSRFNPLSRFTPDNMEAESKALAAALFVLGERERDHWNAAAQQLLAAIILFVYLSPAIPRREKDLSTVRKTLLGNLKGALDAMTEMDQADGLLRDLAVSFIATPEKEFGSIVSSAQRQTEILDNPFIIACLKAEGPGAEVDFKQWRKGTMTVYLCLSAPKFPTFNRWLRLVLTSALDDMTDTLNPPPLPVCFMLDELATLGHLAAVENAIGLAAGYGIQLVTVFQDVAQMRDLYKGRWASFIGNAGVRALFNLDDYDTAEYWSKFIGGRLVETRSQQQDLYGYSKGDNVGETMRPLMSPADMMLQFAKGVMLVLVQGERPFGTTRTPYWQDQTLTGTWDDPRPNGQGRPPVPPIEPGPFAPPPFQSSPVQPPARSPWATPGSAAPRPKGATKPAEKPRKTFAAAMGGVLNEFGKAKAADSPKPGSVGYDKDLFKRTENFYKAKPPKE